MVPDCGLVCGHLRAFFLETEDIRVLSFFFRRHLCWYHQLDLVLDEIYDALSMVYVYGNLYLWSSNVLPLGSVLLREYVHKCFQQSSYHTDTRQTLDLTKSILEPFVS